MCYTSSHAIYFILFANSPLLSPSPTTSFPFSFFSVSHYLSLYCFFYSLTLFLFIFLCLSPFHIQVSLFYTPFPLSSSTPPSLALFISLPAILLFLYISEPPLSFSCTSLFPNYVCFLLFLFSLFSPSQSPIFLSPFISLSQSDIDYSFTSQFFLSYCPLPVLSLPLPLLGFSVLC